MTNARNSAPIRVVCFALLALLLLGATGCQNTRRRSDTHKILDPRVVVPPPYKAPPAADESSRAKPPVHWQPSSSFIVQPASHIAELPPQETIPELDIRTAVAPPPAALPALPALPVETVDAVASMPPPVARTEAPRIEPQPLPAAPLVSPLKHKVKKGESLWSIARTYGVSIDELAAQNAISPKAMLAVNKELSIPPGGRFIPPSERPPIHRATVAKSTKPAATRPAANETVRPTAQQPVPANGLHTVAKNESLWLISRRYGVSITDLRQWNSLPAGNDTLQIGQSLLVRQPGDATTSRPPRTPAPVSTAPVTTPHQPEQPAVAVAPAKMVPTANVVPVSSRMPDTLKDIPHFVNSKDTLQSIAEMYGSKVDWIKQANPGISSDADLQPEMELKVPFEDIVEE